MYACVMYEHHVYRHTCLRHFVEVSFHQRSGCTWGLSWSRPSGGMETPLSSVPFLSPSVPFLGSLAQG